MGHGRYRVRSAAQSPRAGGSSARFWDKVGAMLRAGSPRALASLACALLVIGCSTDPCAEGRCIDLGALPPPADAGVEVTSADAACAMQSARAERGSGQPL